MSRTFRPVSITLTERDRQKLDRLASINGMNRSDMVRQMIRLKRLPREKRPRKAKTILGAADEE